MQKNCILVALVVIALGLATSLAFAGEKMLVDEPTIFATVLEATLNSTIAEFKKANIPEGLRQIMLSKTFLNDVIIPMTTSFIQTITWDEFQVMETERRMPQRVLRGAIENGWRIGEEAQRRWRTQQKTTG